MSYAMFTTNLTEALLREKAKEMDRTKVLGNWRALLLIIPCKGHGEHHSSSPNTNPSVDTYVPSAPPPPTPLVSSFQTKPNVWTGVRNDFKTVEVEGRSQPFFPTTIMDAYFEIKEAASLYSRVHALYGDLDRSESYAATAHSESVYSEANSDEDEFSGADDSYDEGRRGSTTSSYESGDESSFDEATLRAEGHASSRFDPQYSDSVVSGDSEYEDESSEEGSNFDSSFATGLRRRDTVIAENISSPASTAWIHSDESNQTDDRPFFTNPWDSTAPAYLGPIPITDSSLRVEPIRSHLAEENARFFACAEARANAVRANENVGPLDVDETYSKEIISARRSARRSMEVPRRKELTIETIIEATLHYQKYFKKDVTHENFFTAIRELEKHERRSRNAGRARAPCIPFNE
ncbi:hypothetical protein AAF712_007087 [Marasmius tenuissimus]|uniref:Uncharacterized protein n=1 Tax=Marasmius tenuissimus TaxID=585030 RepID=A0ABR2ZXD8_9AGAR